jgi:hypothetical protein
MIVAIALESVIVALCLAGIIRFFSPPPGDTNRPFEANVAWSKSIGCYVFLFVFSLCIAMKAGY